MATCEPPPGRAAGVSSAPEQRAARIVAGQPNWMLGSPLERMLEAEIASAIRSAENAALERAARHVYAMDHDMIGVADSIRELKSRKARATT